MIKSKKKLSPILLLDDISDKLDNHRIHHLLDIIVSEDMGQIFITDTDNSNIQGFITAKGFDTDYFQVDGGIIKPL